jgi:thymidylate synthase (FAD)
MLQRIERTGRVCYKSEEKISDGSAEKFVRMILKRGHESVIEHESISVRFVVDRGVSHELVRHRLCSFSQESMRYCDYGGGVTFIIPPWLSVTIGEYSAQHATSSSVLGGNRIWMISMATAEEQYARLLDSGWSPRQARSVLPNSLKTEVIVTANLREWRHILRLRTSSAAHPQMREVMVPLLTELKEYLPVIFGNIEA